MDLWKMFIMAVLPVVKIFVTCGFGAYLGHPSVNILTEDGRIFLNKLVVVAFTPAFVFTKLARSVSWENICNWWYMPFNIGLCFVCGGCMGLLVLKYTKIPPHLRNLILACCAAGNTGNVPLVLIPAICDEDGNPFGRTVSCSRDAEAYVSYGMWVGIALTWTVVYRLLQPPGFQSKGPVPPVGNYGGSPGSSDFGDFQAGGLEMEEFNPRSNNIIVVTKPDNIQKSLPSAATLPSPGTQGSRIMSPGPSSPPVPDMTEDLTGYFHFYIEKYELKKVFNPPTCAAILGLLAGGIPFLKSLCEGPFLVFIQSGEIIGILEVSYWRPVNKTYSPPARCTFEIQAMIPCMNMILGATLIQGAGKSELEMPPLVGIILVRLVALPVIGMISIKLAHDLGMLPADPLFHFVLLVQFTMPTAINIGTLSQLFGVGEKESALVLFYAYLSASVFMTFWIIIYINYVFT